MTETSAPFSTSVSLGQQLAEMRQQKGISIQEVSTRLRFSTRQLTLLEAGQYDALPDMTFVRAMIRTYARFLEADPAPLIAALEEERPDAIPRLRVVQPVAVPSQGVTFFREVQAVDRRWVAAALLVLVLLLICVWLWHLDDTLTEVGAPQNAARQPMSTADPAANRPAQP